MKQLKIVQLSPCRIIHMRQKHLKERVVVNKLVVSDARATYLLDHDDIIFSQSKGNYTTIYSKNARPVTTSLVLKEIQNRLPNDLFIRIHQSYLIQINSLKIIRGNSLWLSGDTEIPIARRRKKELMDLLSK